MSYQRSPSSGFNYRLIRLSASSRVGERGREENRSRTEENKKKTKNPKHPLCRAVWVVSNTRLKMRTLLRGPVGCVCVCVWRTGEEYKLVFNFTKEGFWLSQSIFPPTPVHHNYQPVARGRAHNKQGGEGLERAAEQPPLMCCCRHALHKGGMIVIHREAPSLRWKRRDSDHLLPKIPKPDSGSFAPSATLHVTFTRHASSFSKREKKKKKRRVCHNVWMFSLVHFLFCHFFGKSRWASSEQLMHNKTQSFTSICRSLWFIWQGMQRLSNNKELLTFWFIAFCPPPSIFVLIKPGRWRHASLSLRHISFPLHQEIWLHFPFNLLWICDIEPLWDANVVTSPLEGFRKPPETKTILPCAFLPSLKWISFFFSFFF